MGANNIEKTIVKYLTQEADSDDLDLLSGWIQAPENRVLFENFVKIHFKLALSLASPNVGEIKGNLLQKIRKDKGKVHNLKMRKKIFKYAAAAVVVFGLAFAYIFKDSFSSNSLNQVLPIIVNNQIVPGNSKAILTLETGELVVLKEGISLQMSNASSNGQIIEYITNDSAPEPVFNYLTVPRGGQFQLNLSDGTRVWLNSETQLKYPVSFTNGESRQVELVYGEAYFDVSPSLDHNGAEFKVLNENQEVRVVGTEFNVKAYRDESKIFTTLVEGKVEVSSINENQILAPNQQSILNINHKLMMISNVNVKFEIAWINGEFIIQNKSLKEIMLTLSRWYDMNVTFENKDLEKVRFMGILRKNQSIIDILNIIKSFNIIKNYEINGKHVILK